MWCCRGPVRVSWAQVVTDSCEPTIVGDWNWTVVLWKSSKYFWAISPAPLSSTCKGFTTHYSLTNFSSTLEKHLLPFLHSLGLGSQSQGNTAMSWLLFEITFVLLYKKEGQQDGSVSKEAQYQIWWPKLTLRMHTAGCPIVSMCSSPAGCPIAFVCSSHINK